MKELKCRNCGGVDFIREGGIWICSYCGSKYLDSSGQNERIRYYLSKAEEALDNDQYKKMNDNALKIHEIDPDNAKAWLYRMYYAIFEEKGYDEIVDAGWKAIQNDTGENSEAIKKRVYLAFVSLGHGGITYALSMFGTTGVNRKEAEQYFDKTMSLYAELDMSVFAEDSDEWRDYKDTLREAEKLDYILRVPKKEEGYIDTAHEARIQKLKMLWKKVEINKDY